MALRRERSLLAGGAAAAGKSNQRWSGPAARSHRAGRPRRGTVRVLVAGRSASVVMPLTPMARQIEKIVADFDALTAYDFDYANASANGWERLQQLCDEMSAINQPAVCA